MNTNKLIEQLNILQSNCIGLVKNRFTKDFELVVEEINQQLVTVTIGELGGVSINHIPASYGLFKRFPDNKSLLQMKGDSYELDRFCKSFNQ